MGVLEGFLANKHVKTAAGLAILVGGAALVVPDVFAQYLNIGIVALGPLGTATLGDVVGLLVLAIGAGMIKYKN